MADKARGPGRRDARQAATRRAEIVEAQAAADPAVTSANRSRSTQSRVEEGDSCRDEREGRGPARTTTSAAASRARVDAGAIEAGRVPSATGTSTRKAKRAATGTSRVTESRAARATGAGAAGSTRKPPLAGRASTGKKASGVSRTARKRS